MNAGEMVNALRRRTGYPVDDPLVTGEALFDALNEALGAIAAETDWPWLRVSTTFSTTAGDRTYATPTSWVRTDRILDPDGDPLERADARQLEDDYGTDRGTPRFWSTSVESETEVILLVPTPDAARTYTHHYVRAEKVLTSDSESPYLPAQFHRAAVALAEAFAHEIGRDAKRAEAARDRYEKVWRPRMLDDRRRSRGPVRPRIREGSWW